MRTIQLLFALFFASMVGLAYAGYGSGPTTSGSNSYGTSNVTLGNNTMTVPPGSSGRGTFNVTLYSGAGYNTNLYVLSQSQLTYSTGINISISPQWGKPTFSGTFNISVPKSTAQGTYKILFGAGGGDPSGNPALLTLVVGPLTTSTSIATTSVATVSAATTALTTIAPVTTAAGGSAQNQAQNSGSSGSSGWGLALIVVVVVIVALLAWKMMQPQAKKPQQTS